MKRRIVALGLLVATCSMTLLTGCHFTPVIPSEEEVLEYVDEICPSEDKTYTKKKSQSSDGSTLYEYTFSSEERDLEFTVEATSYLERGSSGSTVPFTWSPSITDSYCNSIREYYFDEVMDVFERYEDQLNMDEKKLMSGEKYRDSISVNISSYTDIQVVAEFCEELSDIYSSEKQYNGYEWMDIHPLYEIHMYREPSNGYNSIAKLKINGKNSYEDYYEVAENKYVQSVYDGKIEDPLVTDFTGYHKSVLEITIDGDEFDVNDINSYKPNKWKADQFVAKYDYETGSYYLPMNIKVFEVNPELLEFYVESAGGKIGKTGRDYQEFKIGSDDYEIDIEISGKFDTRYDDFDIYKNGKKLKINVLEKTSEGQYVFWISVEDMADIFGFDYDIYEELGIMDISF